MSLKIKKIPHADFGVWYKAEEENRVAFGRSAMEALQNWMEQFYNSHAKPKPKIAKE